MTLEGAKARRVEDVGGAGAWVVDPHEGRDLHVARVTESAESAYSYFVS